MKLICDRHLIYNFFQGFARRKVGRGKHKWFAWYPVKVAYQDCRWLECVQREAFYKPYTKELVIKMYYSTP